MSAEEDEAMDEDNDFDMACLNSDPGVTFITFEETVIYVEIRTTASQERDYDLTINYRVVNALQEYELRMLLKSKIIRKQENNLFYELIRQRYRQFEVYNHAMLQPSSSSDRPVRPEIIPYRPDEYQQSISPATPPNPNAHGFQMPALRTPPSPQVRNRPISLSQCHSPNQNTPFRPALRDTPIRPVLRQSYTPPPTPRCFTPSAPRAIKNTQNPYLRLNPTVQNDTPKTASPQIGLTPPIEISDQQQLQFNDEPDRSTVRANDIVEISTHQSDPEPCENQISTDENDNDDFIEPPLGSSQQYIENLSRRNPPDPYFLQPVNNVEQINKEALQLKFHDGICIIGKSPLSDTEVKGVLVGNEHCKVEFLENEGALFLTDLSTNGTSVLDIVEQEETVLENGDTVMVQSDVSQISLADQQFVIKKGLAREYEPTQRMDATISKERFGTSRLKVNAAAAVSRFNEVSDNPNLSECFICNENKYDCDKHSHFHCAAYLKTYEMFVHAELVKQLQNPAAYKLPTQTTYLNQINEMFAQQNIKESEAQKKIRKIVYVLSLVEKLYESAKLFCNNHANFMKTQESNGRPWPAIISSMLENIEQLGNQLLQKDLKFFVRTRYVGETLVDAPGFSNGSIERAIAHCKQAINQISFLIVNLKASFLSYGFDMDAVLKYVEVPLEQLMSYFNSHPTVEVRSAFGGCTYLQGRFIQSAVTAVLNLPFMGNCSLDVPKEFKYLPRHIFIEFGVPAARILMAQSPTAFHPLPYAKQIYGHHVASKDRSFETYATLAGVPHLGPKQLSIYDFKSIAQMSTLYAEGGHLHHLSKVKAETRYPRLDYNQGGVNNFTHKLINYFSMRPEMQVAVSHQTASERDLLLMVLKTELDLTVDELKIPGIQIIPFQFISVPDDFTFVAKLDGLDEQYLALCNGFLVHKNRFINCCYCKLSGRSPSDILKHLSKIHPNPNSTYRCPECRCPLTGKNSVDHVHKKFCFRQPYTEVVIDLPAMNYYRLPPNLKLNRLKSEKKELA